MEKFELEFLTAAVDAIAMSKDPSETARRIKEIIDNGSISDIRGNEIEIAAVSADMIKDSDTPYITKKRMKWLIDHIESSEIYGRQHRQWLEAALKSDCSNTIDFDKRIGEYVGSRLFG